MADCTGIHLSLGVKIKTLSLLELDVDAIADYLKAESLEDIEGIEEDGNDKSSDNDD
jgi:hypothetical protein